MSFYIFLFCCSLLVPLTMLIAGCFMYKKPPKKINSFFGYRTERSRKNMETWLFAHELCGRLWMKLGAFMLILTVIALFPFVHSGDDTISLVLLVIQAIQTCVLIGSIFPVEAALKRTFDENGNRR